MRVLLVWLLSALLPQETELSDTAPAGQSFPDR